MARKISIKAGDVQLTASLGDTATAQAIWDALPISAKGNTWGDEIYFSIPVQMGEESGQEVVSLGDIAYWPPGKAFCMFFGSTPVSRGDEIRPASAVNVVGAMEGDVNALKQVPNGAEVTLGRIDS